MLGITCSSEYRPSHGTESLGCNRHHNHPGPHESHGYVWSDLDENVERKQVGGDHYQGGDLQPVDVIDAFHLDFYEGNALKYLLRYEKKNGKEDLLKAIHYIEMIIERKYP